MTQTPYEEARATVEKALQETEDRWILLDFDTVQALLSRPEPDGAAEAEAFLEAAISNSPQPLKDLGELLTRLLDEDQWATAESYLLALASPVPTEPTDDDQREIVRRVVRRALYMGFNLNELPFDVADRKGDELAALAAKVIMEQLYRSRRDGR